MIPILYPGTETSYTSNGLGRLNEIVSCTATEERNGIYEVEFEYPVTGRFYQQMVSMVEAYATGNRSLMGTIACIHDDKHDIQPFDLYAVSAPIDGIATFNAHHVSYRLGTMPIAPLTATSAADAMTQIPLKIAGQNNFTFWTDKGTSGSFALETPEVVRNILGGQEGSLLDVFGTGEYEFDKFTVKLYQSRNQGQDSGVTIRYGKNLTDFERELDGSGHFNAIAPYWKGQITDEDTGESEDVLVYLSGLYIQSPEVTGTPIVAAMDFSTEFDEIPTQQELQARALKYLADNKPWLPDDNIRISFVQLWQTTEYENVAALQRLSLCDTVSVYYPELGIISESQKIIKVTYNVLLERYDEMELGKPTTSLASSISSDARANFESELEQAKKNALTSSQMQAAIAHATELITGGLGGFIIFNRNADGEPQEMLIMDTDDVNTAVHVIRINQNGIGFSSNGYNGPFTSAWTIDGSFNADFITAGSISANMISGGTLKLGGANNGNGVMRVYDASNNEIASLDLNGLYQYGSKHLTPYDRSYGWVSVSGDLDAPYYGEYPEDSYKNPTRYPNQVWYKRKLEVNSGGLTFKNLQTNSTSGVVNPPTETTVGRLRSGGYGLTLFASSGMNLDLAANGGGTQIVVGDRIDPDANIPSSESKSRQIGVQATDGVVLWSGTSVRFNGDGPIIYELYPATSSRLGLSIRNVSAGRFESYYSDYAFQRDGTFSCDNLQVNYTKQRIVKTDDYGEIGLYCYETPTPMFGDIGEGTIDETGLCYIFLESKFAETISSNPYQVFLQRYGEGECYISERKPGYFVVTGTPGLTFAWELKAKQSGFDQLRLEKKEETLYIEDFEFDYASDAANYIKELEEGRVPA